MKLINLTNCTDNNYDEVILNALTKSSDTELLNYVSNITSDLLNSVYLNDELKLNAKNSFNKYNEIEIGELSTYMILTPYVQTTLSKTSNWQEKATAFLESYIGYIVSTLDRDEFLNNLTEMKDILNISDKFYSNLISFFGDNKESINNNILSKLEF